MTSSQCRLYDNVEWDQYTTIKAYSFSSLRSPDVIIKPTAKMLLGTRVDNYMFEPARYDGGDYKLVKTCAMVLNKTLGKIRYRSQLTATANFMHNGYVMPVRGRLDMFVPGLVVDLKVSEMDPYKAIEHFRYDWQLTGYCYMTQVNRALLISINPKTFKETIVPIKLTTDWWEQQIQINGTRIAA